MSIIIHNSRFDPLKGDKKKGLSNEIESPLNEQIK
jgi:hypothetical protein